MTWSIQTPTTPGAIGIVQCVGLSRAELEAAAGALGLPAIGVGEIRVARVLDVDEAVVARWDERTIHLMPHGGPAILRALADALTARGFVRDERVPARALYPEARSRVEAEMLDALARAPSPLAIDLLLDQPRRWSEHEAGRLGAPDLAHGSRLRRLIDPPLVVAVGAPNVGKSTLLNALAGRPLAVVSPEPGTTRDYVGARLDLAGLVVRYADLPGFRAPADAIEAASQDAARSIAAQADLVLLMGDASAPPAEKLAGSRACVLRVASRIDLGPPRFAYDLAVSARTGEGMEGMVLAIRDALVPPADLADPRPWRFWDEMPASGPRPG